jgi:tetratricopeptide (TPR) repeat protein
MLAEVNFERVDSRDRSEDGRRQFRLALDVLLRLRPRSSLAYRQAGAWMLKLYERSHDPQDAEQAIAYYRRAVELYPHSALTRAGLALALAAVGQSEEARLVARRALELDAMMPHVDKKLPDDVSGRLDRLESSPSDD